MEALTTKEDPNKKKINIQEKKLREILVCKEDDFTASNSLKNTEIIYTLGKMYIEIS